MPSVGMGVFQLPGSNALATAERVKAKMRRTEEAISRKGSTTTSATTRRPISANRSSEVFQTLFDAVLLVAIVVLVFLQNWRSALIPLDRRARGDHRHLRRHGR